MSETKLLRFDGTREFLSSLPISLSSVRRSFCACCLLFFSRPDRMQCVWVGNGLLVDTCQTVMAASNEQVKGSSSIRFVFRL